MPAKSKPAKPARREVTAEVVATAIEMRESGAKWSEVAETTGFNGAILRPHIARAQKNAGSVAAKIVPVELNAKSIAAARAAGMPWYAIALALDQPEAKVRKLGAEGGATTGRVYAKVAKAEKPAPKKPAAKKAAAKKAPRKAAAK